MTIIIRSASCPSELIAVLLETEEMFVLDKFAFATSCAISRILFSFNMALSIRANFEPRDALARVGMGYQSTPRIVPAAAQLGDLSLGQVFDLARRLFEQLVMTET